MADYWNVDFKKYFLMYWVSFQEEFSPQTNISFPQDPLLQCSNQGEP